MKMKTFLIICGIALVAFAIYRSQNRTSRGQYSGELEAPKSRFPNNKLIDEIIRDLKISPEQVERLALSDVVSYFKMLNLKKGIDVPFIGKGVLGDVTVYLLATYNETSDSIENAKLIAPSSVDEDVLSTMGNEPIVVLT